MLTGLLGLLTSRIGLLAMAFAGIIIFYEGIPLGPLRLIPFVGPVLESVADGRVDRERKAGVIQERLVWQEQQRRVLAKRLIDEKAKQAELDAIAADYQASLDKSAEDAAQIAGLEDALNKEKANAPPGSAPAVAIHRGVSVKLNAVGR